MNSKDAVVVFGGCGYIGRRLSRYLLTHKRATKVVLVDIREPSAPMLEGEEWLYGDVRESLLLSRLCGLLPSWIFNLAAIHREPGHCFEEYFDTNIPGARNVCDYARHVECRHLFFTASIAVYGPTRVATSEDCPKYPSSGYGISKYLAEQIHEQWLAEEAERKLVICRPGVVYGPGDPGNMLRMIRAIRRGLFVFPGSLNIHKSYAYIEGLLESMVFTMDHPDRLIRYNYVETPTEPLIDIARASQQFLGKRSPILAIPSWVLKPVAHGVQWLTRGRSPIHPKRVEKAGTPTHIVPQWLLDHGFVFNYPYQCSLDHWSKESPLDFE